MEDYQTNNKEMIYIYERIKQEVEFLHDQHDELLKKYKYVNLYLEGQLAAWRGFELLLEQVVGHGVFNMEAFLTHAAFLHDEFKKEYLEKTSPTKEDK